MNHDATDKVLPDFRPGGLTEDSDASYPSAPVDITVREQQYAQSDIVLHAEPEIGGEHNIQELISASQRQALDWLDNFLGSHAQDEIVLTDIQLNIVKSRIASFNGKQVFKWYECKNKRTAYVTKAALRNYMLDKRERIHRMLLQTLQSLHSVTPATLQFLLDFSRYAMRAERDGVFDKHDRSAKGRWVSHWENEPPVKRARKRTDTSKRNTVNRLPVGYAERLAEEMGYEPAIDLLILTGLRPFEIPSVKLELGDFGMLHFNILSAKTPKGKPERWRRITTDADHPSTARLVAMIDQVDFSGFKKGPFRLRLGRASKKLFGIRVSPRCFRHAVAGTLKESEGADRKRTSMALGHDTTRSTCGYGNVPGQRRTGKGKTNPIVAVSSTGEVRETRSMVYCQFRDGLQESGEPATEVRLADCEKAGQE
jgi:integrase